MMTFASPSKNVSFLAEGKSTPYRECNDFARVHSPRSSVQCRDFYIHSTGVDELLLVHTLVLVCALVDSNYFDQFKTEVVNAGTSLV